MMNLYLHDIGTDPDHPPITIGDSLARPSKQKVDMVLTNPPFGTKSSITVTSGGGKVGRGALGILAQNFGRRPATSS